MSEDLQIWYWADQKGVVAFTQEVKYAVTDKNGIPVMATGTQRNLVRRAGRARADVLMDKSLDDVWEKLLDLMEESYILTEKLEKMDLETDVVNDFAVPEQADLVKVKDKMHGIAMAIALIEYNHEFKTDESKALERIKREAQHRYEQAVGE